MRNLPTTRTLLLGAVLALCIGTLGCGSKSVVPAATQGPSAPAGALVQQKQRRTAVLQSLRTMTPQQRAAYFNTHPEDVPLIMH